MVRRPSTKPCCSGTRISCQQAGRHGRRCTTPGSTPLVVPSRTAGRGGEIVGEHVKGLPHTTFAIQTKTSPLSGQLRTNSIPSSPAKALVLGASGGMRLKYVYVYLVHGSKHAQGIESVAMCTGGACSKNLCVSSVLSPTPQKTLPTSPQLWPSTAPHTLPVQCEFSLLNQWRELYNNDNEFQAEDAIKALGERWTRAKWLRSIE